MPTQDTEFAAAALHAPDSGEGKLQQRLTEERLAIARELHDELGGALAALRFDLSWLARQLTDPPAQQRLQQATETLQRAIAATQQVVLNLRSPPLEDGLLAALQALIAGFKERTGVPATLHAPHEAEDLPEAVQRVVYRTVQEALTNIGKHAHCREASVALSLRSTALRLLIEDDGVGMSNESIDGSVRLGLRGMRERATAIGGTVEVAQRAGGGTTVLLNLPLVRSIADADSVGTAEHGA